MEMKKHQEDQFAKLATFLSDTRQPFTIVQTDQITRAIELLKVLPAAQDAVLEYYGKFFDYAIVMYLKQLKHKVLYLRWKTYLCNASQHILRNNQKFVLF